MRRRAIIAVVGGGEKSVEFGSPTYKLAQEVGKRIAERGGILLCGGGSGVMEAAAQAAFDVSKRTVGIMKKRKGGKKKGLGLMVWTGLGEGRNYVNAASADAMIALEGEAGTLSEIALALKLGKPIFALRAWEFLRPAGFLVHCFMEPDKVVEEAFLAVGAPEGFVSAAISYPLLPGQSAQRQRFAKEVKKWSQK
jgi:uncharacterized protein (TIGR00725 family)